MQSPVFQQQQQSTTTQSSSLSVSVSVSSPMSLRKVSSINSASPLKKNKMDLFSYGVHMESINGATNGSNNYSVSVDEEEEDHSNHHNEYDYDFDEYDKTAKKMKAGPTSGNNNSILRVVTSLPKLAASTMISPSNSYEQAAVVTPPPPPTSQQQQRQFSTPKRSSSCDSNLDKMVQSQSSKLPPPFVLQVTAIASLGGVLFGYDMGVIAGALPQLTQTFDLTDKQQELVVSILYVGGGLGAAVGGSFCDLVGRKLAILFTDLTFVLGASILFLAPHLVAVCLGRIIVGFAVAVSGIADVSYLHEIAPTQWRGAIVSVNEACISLGFLLAFVVGAVFTPPSSNAEDDDIVDDDLHPPRGWRYMFALGGVMALIQFVGMWSMPESPVWLKNKGRHDEAKAALRQIHGGTPPEEDEDYPTTTAVVAEDADPSDSFDDEYNNNYNHNNMKGVASLPQSSPRSSQEVAIESKASYESLSSNPDNMMTMTTTTPVSSPRTRTIIPSASPNSGGPSSLPRPHYNLQEQCLICIYRIQRGWNQLRRVIFRYRRQVWIAIFLSVTQQFCGQTSVLNYAPTILKAVVQQDGADDNDDDEELSGWATLSIGMVKFIATVLVIWKIEQVGRRRLLLVGMGTIAFGLLLVAIAFSSNSTFARQQHADENNVMVQKGSGYYFALPGVLLVVSGYSMSFGPLTWLITSELFPTEIRGRALGTSTIVTYLCAALVTYSFLTAQSWVGTTAVFMIYMLITVLGMVFAWLAIPDTGGKTQDEINAELSTMPWWRRFSCSEPKRHRRRRRSSAAGSRLSAASSTLEDGISGAAGGVLFPPGTVLNGAGRTVEAELT